MISLKLKAIAFFVEKNDRIVDIGCDHAYLDIYLVQNNLCKNVIASDINNNALNNAKKNIQKYGLSKKIKCILSDGLKNIDVKNINTLVIAGMGTKTIKHILNDEKTKNIEKIILSSNNDHYRLRKYMQQKQYCLIDEKIIFEKNHYYVICKYIKGKQKLSKKELMFGIYKKENSKYYQYIFEENRKILKKIPLSKFKERYKLKKQNAILKKYINIK